MLGMCLWNVTATFFRAHQRTPQPQGPHRRRLLGSSVSSALGNWSWAMTCTHWSPFCQTQSEEFSRSLASLFLTSGKPSKGEQHQFLEEFPNPVDTCFHQAATEG